ncbi:MAG: hypothetical protein FWG61_01085 [Firmicutes bacterium]|nr:hypothetical protein [Bacillota bacterium]
MRKIKHLSTILMVFALLLVVGTVYAATSGQFTFNGTVTLNPPVSEDIVKLDIIPIDGTMIVVDDGQKAIINVTIDTPGSVSIPFKVENTGDLPAVITKISTDNDDEIVILGDYEDLLEIGAIEVGEITPLTYLEIIIVGDVVEEETVCEFTITMDYEAE